MTEFTTGLPQAFNIFLSHLLPLADRLTVDMGLYLTAAMVAKLAHRHMWLVYLGFALVAACAGHW